MAINTVNEKLALLGQHLPISADGLGQADKQQLLWGYPGLLWAAPAFEAVTIDRPDKYYFDRRSPRLRHALFNHIEWEDDVSYQSNRVVAYSGSLYKSLQATNKNQNPGTEAAYWEEIAPISHTHDWTDIQDLTDITELTAVADADLIPIWDASAGAYLAVTLSTLKTYMTA